MSKIDLKCGALSKDLCAAAKALEAPGCTFAGAHSGELYTSEKRGVAPLVELCDSGRNMSGWSFADKVVGKAPAMLYVLLGAREVYAPVMTYEAVSILEHAGIHCEHDTLTEKIIRRDGKDICPMEKEVADINDPEKALDAIRLKLAAIQSE